MDINNDTDRLQLVPMKYRYPNLRQMLLDRGLTYKSIYLQMHPMRNDQFSHIILGDIPEPDGFQTILIQALAKVGVDTTIRELKRRDNQE